MLISNFVFSQVATVLANMAAKEEYRTDLTSGGGLVLLMCFLQLRPSVGHGAPQLAACERIQQKAAIALARLCTNPETSNIVADMQGEQKKIFYEHIFKFNLQIYDYYHQCLWARWILAIKI